MSNLTGLPPTPPASADDSMDTSTGNAGSTEEGSSSVNLQRYDTVVYLRDEGNSDDDVRILLYDTFKEVKQFTDPCPCISYAHQNVSTNQVYLVLSHLNGSLVAQVLKNHRNIFRIFLHRRDNDEVSSGDEQQNVTVFTDHNNLNQLLTENQTNSAEQSTPSSRSAPYDGKTKIFDERSLKSAVADLSKESAAFVWFRLLIDLILRLSPVQTDRDELLRTCKAFVQAGDIMPNAVEKFKNDYNCNEAVKWYSTPSSVFKLVNEAFRTEEIDSIYLFRSLIKDLHDHIVSLQRNEPGKFYRGALIPGKFLLNFKDNVGNLVSMNWFMSTTTSRQIADLYSGCGCNINGCRSVVFEFTVLNGVQSEPYAPLNDQTNVIDEEEILFSVCSIWRIESVQTREGYWYIELSNGQVEDPAAHNLATYLREKIGDVPSILTLACFLYERGDYAKAEFFCRKIIHESSNPSQQVRVSALNLVALCRTKMNDPYVALDKLLKTIQLLDPTALSTELTSNTPDRDLEEIEPVTIYPERLRAILEANCPVAIEMFSPADVTVPVIYNNIGLIHCQLWNLDSAKKYLLRAKNISSKAERHDNQTAFICNNLAAVCYSRKEYNEAAEFYREAIVTGLTKLNRDHPFIEKCKQNFQYALKRSEPQT